MGFSSVEDEGGTPKGGRDTYGRKQGKIGDKRCYTQTHPATKGGERRRWCGSPSAGCSLDKTFSSKNAAP